MDLLFDELYSGIARMCKSFVYCECMDRNSKCYSTTWTFYLSRCNAALNLRHGTCLHWQCLVSDLATILSEHVTNYLWEYVHLVCAELEPKLLQRECQPLGLSLCLCAVLGTDCTTKFHLVSYKKLWGLCLTCEGIVRVRTKCMMIVMCVLNLIFGIVAHPLLPIHCSTTRHANWINN